MWQKGVIAGVLKLRAWSWGVDLGNLWILWVDSLGGPGESQGAL